MEVLTRHNLMKDLMFLTITWNLVNGCCAKHKLSKYSDTIFSMTTKSVIIISKP